MFIMTVDPQHRYSNEAEKGNQDIYDDFKLRLSRYRDPQPQVVDNYSYLFNLRPNIYKYCTDV